MRHPEMTDERIHGLMRKAVHGGLSPEEAADVTLELWRARRVEAEQADHLRQKEESIRTLADALESMTHVATGLHALYRGTAKTESDGSHEKLFAHAMVLVTKARKP